MFYHIFYTLLLVFVDVIGVNSLAEEAMCSIAAGVLFRLVCICLCLFVLYLFAFVVLFTFAASVFLSL